MVAIRTLVLSSSLLLGLTGALYACGGDKPAVSPTAPSTDADGGATSSGPRPDHGLGSAKGDGPGASDGKGPGNADHKGPGPGLGGGKGAGPGNSDGKGPGPSDHHGPRQAPKDAGAI